MKKVIKNNYKIIVGIVIGLVISVSGVYAATTIIKAIEVSYDNTKSHGSFSTVQESIDELYGRNGVHSEKWVDPILHGADPVLKEPLIPVDIKPNGEVYYANENSEWYNYSEKRWANAVILNDNVKKDKYTVGKKIEEDDIKGYFVWIPRYKYKVWDLGKYDKTYTLNDITDDNKNPTLDTALWKLAGSNARLIDIVFGNEDYVKEDYTKEEEKTIQGSGISGGDGTVEVGDYLIHPAFKLGNKVLNGIWVGKFETGYRGASSTNSAQVNNEEPASIIVKPDVYSWRGINVKNIFMSAYNYKSTSNSHNTILDPHMMKNTEWGAVAYLSHSAYGIGTEVNINNTSDYKTGYSATADADQRTSPGEDGLSIDRTKTQPWNSATGYLASSTGNISGIYDMNGGSSEYVAACIDGTLEESGFDSNELIKYMNEGYIDKYASDSSRTLYNKRILGDATGEMGPFYRYYHKDGSNRYNSSWHSDNSVFVQKPNSWFYRGGIYLLGSRSGVFYFSSNDGGEFLEEGFRLVLSPNK